MDSECALGLVCVDNACAAMSYWAGANCQQPSGTFRALFRVPRYNRAEPEFYSLPFPNDIRLKEYKGKVTVDVSKHPDPAASLPAEYRAVVTNLLGTVRADVTAFGVNTAVLMRMSHSFNLNTITLTGSNPTLQFVNITPTHADYGKGPGFSMYASTSRGKYICENFITVRPHVGQPLAPSTTYAVLLRKGILDNAGKPAAQDGDFATMLQAGAPTDTDLKAAWEAYQPLRDYMKDKGITNASVISAAVFTTMNPRAKMAQLGEVVGAQAAIDATKLKMELCKGGNTGPCFDGTAATHKCPSTLSNDFDEIQGVFEVPVFQTGKRPYKTAAAGGYIEYDADDKPIVQGTEKLCFALTVPKGATMPAEGWPVVIAAHGTGGNYRSFIGNGTAKNLSEVTDPGDSTKATAFAVISIDAAMHGPRRGSEDDPDELFFNLNNPRASRDNVYQGAADKFQLVRLVEAMDLQAADSPTAEALKLDPAHLYYFGHSQGTVEGIPFLSYEPAVRGTVLSGAGGFLIDSVLNKTSPTNVAGAVRLALADPFLGHSHPLLNIMQLAFEEVDSVNYGVNTFFAPTNGALPKHTFLSMGVADTYTPPETTRALAYVMRISRVRQDAELCGDRVCSGTETCKSCATDCGACAPRSTCGNGSCDQAQGETCRLCPADCPSCPAEFPEANAPLQGNYTYKAAKYTAGMVQYASDGSYDDHFVIYQNATAVTQSTQFLGSAVWDSEQLPTIPAAK